MRVAKYEKEVQTVLNEKVFVTVNDIAAVCPGMPMPSVYSKVNKLIKERKLSVMGKGKYVSAPKAGLSYEITPWMKDVNDYLIATCIGINVCMTEKEGNLFVQVHKSALVKVESELKKRYSNVICKDDFSNFPLNLEGYIVIERLITESPVAIENGMIVPSMEKTIVDLICDKDGEAIDRLSFQKTVESRPFNLDSMMRYAARRGVKEEASAMVSSLDSSRLEMMAKVQKYLSTIPVRKAWVFGSFARGEETPASDLDLLVDYMVDAKLSLLDVIKYKLQLESIVGREVDLIENGYLKPFAIASAERDKYLIYER
jgi:predicted nucleotidyltransferase